MARQGTEGKSHVWTEMRRTLELVSHEIQALTVPHEHREVGMAVEYCPGPGQTRRIRKVDALRQDDDRIVREG